MSQGNTDIVVDLDSLNPKQKAKEFKGTLKDLKSKDDSLKLSSIQKVGKDLRYLSEGGCIVPIFNSFVPKKKSYKYLEDALPLVINILSQLKEVSIEENAAITGLQIALSENNDDIFHGLKECVSLKEPVKKPKAKGKKKDQAPEPDPPENPSVVSIRALSLKLLYNLIYPLRKSGTVSSVSDRLRRFDGLTTAICDNVLYSTQGLQNTDLQINTKVEVVQSCLYGLQILAFQSRVNSAACGLVSQHALMEKLPVLLHTKQLSLYAFQIVRSLSMYDSSIKPISTMENVISFLSLSEAVVQKLKDLTVVVEAPAGKGKEAKKEDKSKKGPQTVTVEESDPFDALDVVKLDPKRECVVWLTVFSATFIEIVKRATGVLESELVDRLYAIISAFLPNEGLWEICRQDLSPPMDEPVDRVLEFALWLLGSLSETSFSIRLQLCRSDCVSLVLSFLLNSKKIYPSNPTDDANNVDLSRLYSVRRFAEKAALSFLLPETIETSKIGNPQECRWFANYRYSITDEMYGAYGQNLLNLFSDLVSNVDDFDLTSRAVRILASIVLPLKLSQRTELLTQSQADRILTTKLSALVYAIGSAVSKTVQIEIAAQSSGEPSSAALSKLHDLDPSLIEGLYLTLSVIEVFIPFSSDHVKIIAEKTKIELFARLVDIAGPTLSSTYKIESQVTIFNPREYTWDLEASSCNMEVQFLRPVVLDVLTAVISSDVKYRTFDGTFPIEPGKPFPATTSPTEEAAFNAIKLVADIVLKIFLQSVDWNIFPDDEVLRLNVNRDQIPHDLIRISALQYFVAVGKCGPIGLAGILDSVAGAVFSGNSAGSSLSSLIAAIQFVDENNSPLDLSQIVWKRPLVFADVTNLQESTSLKFMQKSLLSKNFTVWPFIALSSAIQSVMMDPLSSPQCALLSIQAASSLMRSPFFRDENQPVIIDILIASFLSVGGGFSAVGLTGSFGHINEEEKANYSQFASFLLSRGKSRELFWQNYYEINKEPVNIDPKTGKPVPKKEDKKKDAKEPKKDPKAPVIVPVITEIIYNIESTEESNDPNRGPGRLPWKELLDFSSENHFHHSKKSTLLISAVQSSLFDLAALLMEQDANINQQDEFGCSALMYALLLEDLSTTEKLLSYRNSINVNLADCRGNGTIYYAMCSLRNNINQISIVNLFRGFCQDSSVYRFKPISLHGNANLLSLLLQYNASYQKEYRIDLTVTNQDGFPLLLFALGIGSLPVTIGGYSFDVRHEAYYDSSYAILKSTGAPLAVDDTSSTFIPELKSTPRNVIEALLQSGAKLNQSSPTGLAPLHIALAFGDHSLLELFFDHQVEANTVDFLGRHGLHYLLAACPPDFSSVYNSFMARCVHKPIIQIPFHSRNHPLKEENDVDDPVSSGYHHHQQNALSEYFQSNLSKIFPLSAYSTSSLIPAKRIEKYEFLFFCKDYLFQLSPLDYGFLHEYYTRIQTFTEPLTEIIQWNNNCRYPTQTEAKRHRIEAIVSILYEMKREEPCPQIFDQYPSLKLWGLSNPNFSPFSLSPEESYQEEEIRNIFWLLRQAQRIISDNNDIQSTINGYNIQNSLNLLFVPLIHANPEGNTTILKLPLQDYSVLSSSNMIRVSPPNSLPDASLNILQMLSLLLWKGKDLTIGAVAKASQSQGKRNIQYESVELQLIDVIFTLIALNQFYQRDNHFSFITSSSTFPLPEIDGKAWTPVHIALLADHIDLFTMLYQQSFALADIAEKAQLMRQQPLEMLVDAPNLAIASPYSSLRTFETTIVSATQSVSSPKSPSSARRGKKTKQQSPAHAGNQSPGAYRAATEEIDYSSVSSQKTIGFWRGLQLIHYLAHLPVDGTGMISKAVCSRVITIYQQDLYRDDWKQLFNEPSSSPFDWASTPSYLEGISEESGYIPYHRAILNGQLHLLEALSECRQVDVNRKDPSTGYTPLHLLVMFLLKTQRTDTEVERYFQAIATAKDRFDLTVLAKVPVSIDGMNQQQELLEEEENLPVAMRFMTCVEYVVLHRHSHLLKQLLDLRKNDVIEVVLNGNGKSSSLLIQLEEENDQLLRKLQLIVEKPSSDALGETIVKKENENVTDLVEEIVREEEQEEIEEAEVYDEEEKDNDLNSLSGKKEMIANGETVEKSVMEVELDASMKTVELSDEERQDYVLKLRANHAMLQLLLEIINPLDLLDSSAHFHERYFLSELIPPPSDSDQQ